MILVVPSEYTPASPNVPRQRPPWREPSAWAASSTTKRPYCSTSSFNFSMSGARPLRWTGIRARVRTVMRSSASSKSMVNENRFCTRQADRVGSGDEGEVGDDDLVAGSDTETAQDDGQANGCIVGGEHIGHLQVAGEFGFRF